MRTLHFDQPTSADDLREAFSLAAKLRSQGAQVTLVATDSELTITTNATLAMIELDISELGIRYAAA